MAAARPAPDPARGGALVKVDDGPFPDPIPPRRTRRRWLVGLATAALVVAVAGLSATSPPVTVPTVTVDDVDGALSVTVPVAWDRAVAADGWSPPEEKTEYPALSVGTTSGWSDDPDAQGVFVGVLPGSELPPGSPATPSAPPPSRR